MSRACREDTRRSSDVSWLLKVFTYIRRLICTDIFKVKGCMAIAKKNKKAIPSCFFLRGNIFVGKNKDWWNMHILSDELFVCFFTKPSGKHFFSLEGWHFPPITDRFSSYCYWFSSTGAWKSRTASNQGCLLRHFWACLCCQTACTWVNIFFLQAFCLCSECCRRWWNATMAWR